MNNYMKLESRKMEKKVLFNDGFTDVVSKP